MIKQGGKSVKEAIDYVKAPENRRKSFGVLMLEVGKIVMIGLTAMGALVLGEVIEKALMTFPVFAAEIPLIGSLANIIGIFLGAVVAGIAGALIMNLIDRLIARKQKQEITERQIDKGNEVLVKQAQVIAVNREQLHRKKAKTGESIKARHEAAAEVMREATENIFTEKKNDNAERLADMKIEKTRHFNDIDSMWRTIKSQGEEIGSFSRKLEELSDQLTEKINDMLAFKEEIERAEHIKDIASIWENSKNLQEEVSKLSDNLEKRIEKVETEISKIVELAKGQSYFEDIDNIWEGLQEV